MRDQRFVQTIYRGTQVKPLLARDHRVVVLFVPLAGCIHTLRSPAQEAGCRNIGGGGNNGKQRLDHLRHTRPVDLLLFPLVVLVHVGAAPHGLALRRDLHASPDLVLAAGLGERLRHPGKAVDIELGLVHQTGEAIVGLDGVLHRPIDTGDDTVTPEVVFP